MNDQLLAQVLWPIPTFTLTHVLAFQACKALPNEIAASCMDLITNYGSILVAMIDSVDAPTSCLLMGMCAQDVMAFKAPPFPVEMVALFSQMHTLHSAAQQANANECDICKVRGITRQVFSWKVTIM